MNVSQFIRTASPKVRVLKDSPTQHTHTTILRLDEPGAGLSIFFRDLEHARQVLNSALAQVDAIHDTLISEMREGFAEKTP